MKVLFVPVKSAVDYTFVEKIRKHPFNKKVGLVSTIQYLDYLKILNKKIPRSAIAGQLLGCNASHAVKVQGGVDVYLYVGSGIFHPLEVALKTKKPVYIANPTTKKIYKLPQEEITKFLKEKKGKRLRFLQATKVGIIVSQKPGQYFLNKALGLRKSLNKESYIFLTNNINEQEFANFRDIDCWISTACPRLDSTAVIDIGELEFKNFKSMQFPLLNDE